MLSEAGLPTLVLDGDGCDSRNVADGQMVTRVGAFLEQLEGLDVMIGYSCKYAPLGTDRSLRRKSADARRGNRRFFRRAKTLTHANVCCHAKALLTAGAGYKTNWC